MLMHFMSAIGALHAWSSVTPSLTRSSIITHGSVTTTPRTRNAVTMTATITAPTAPPLTWTESPDNTWTFDASSYGAPDPLTVNYIAAGPEDGAPFLLVHGFGASGFHWRRNVNVLAAAGYRVYAIDLIGFGLSSKPIIEYDARLWRDQCAAFLREVAGCGEKNNQKRAIVAGNSIGGYTALGVGAAHPELICGVVSLNGAGRYSPTKEEALALEAYDKERAERPEWKVAVDSALEALVTALQRGAAYAGLYITKQPLRIQQVLRQVYPIHPEAADEELVASIQYAADDEMGLAPPNAIPEVFYRIVSRNSNGGAVPIDELVEELKVPLLLLWGESDPWIVSKLGDKLEACAKGLGKDVKRVSVNAGHCPQDEEPEGVNTALLEFARELGV